jgi:hypothetical protein
MALPFVGNRGIIVNAPPSEKDVPGVSQEGLHLPFENKNKFLSLVGGRLLCPERCGFQGYKERFQVPVLFVEPQAFVRIALADTFLGGKA